MRAHPARRSVAATRPPRRLARVEWGFGILIVALILFVTADKAFRIRDRLSARAAYEDFGDTPAEHERARRAIQFRIAQLTRPDEGAGAVAGASGADSSRLVEAGLLYGRLALLAEADGQPRERDRLMQQGIVLLRQGGSPDPTEQHIRNVILQQGLRTR
jgi:hypothetical protein